VGVCALLCFAYFERDVIISDADLQLLFSDYVFLWPVCVVFSGLVS
jgi:hypothetical protein